MGTKTASAPSPSIEGLDPGAVREIAARHAGTQGALMAALQEIQARCGYLPSAALRILAGEMHLSLVDVYGVATFYKSFTLKPRGKHVITVCLGTACHVRGARRVAETFERRLGIKAGDTTPDREFTLETVNCLGVCALGPMVVADGHYLSNVSAGRVDQIVDRTGRGGYGNGKGEGEIRFPVEASCPHCRHSLMDRTCPLDGRPSIKVEASLEKKRGILRFSSLYGSPVVETKLRAPRGAEVRLACPHCGGGLESASSCLACEGPMAALRIDAGGTLEVCRRIGCDGRALDLNGSGC